MIIIIINNNKKNKKNYSVTCGLLMTSLACFHVVSYKRYICSSLLYSIHFTHLKSSFSPCTLSINVNLSILYISSQPLFFHRWINLIPCSCYSFPTATSKILTRYKSLPCTFSTVSFPKSSFPG